MDVLDTTPLMFMPIKLSLPTVIPSVFPWLQELCYTFTIFEDVITKLRWRPTSHARERRKGESACWCSCCCYCCKVGQWRDIFFVNYTFGILPPSLSLSLLPSVHTLDLIRQVQVQQVTDLLQVSLLITYYNIREILRKKKKT